MPSRPRNGSGEAVCGSLSALLAWFAFAFWSAEVAPEAPEADPVSSCALAAEPVWSEEDPVVVAGEAVLVASWPDADVPLMPDELVPGLAAVPELVSAPVPVAEPAAPVDELVVSGGGVVVEVPLVVPLVVPVASVVPVVLWPDMPVPEVVPVPVELVPVPIEPVPELDDPLMLPVPVELAGVWEFASPVPVVDVEPAVPVVPVPVVAVVPTDPDGAVVEPVAPVVPT